MKFIEIKKVNYNLELVKRIEFTIKRDDIFNTKIYMICIDDEIFVVNAEEYIILQNKIYSIIKKEK